MDNCIFCKIVAGEIPSTKVFENEHILAFLDINPVSVGHTLVIPKKHFVDTLETEEDFLSEIAKAIKVVANAVKKATRADGISVKNSNGEAAGQDVFHTHFHIIPRHHADHREVWNAKTLNKEEVLGVAETIRKEIK